MTRIPEGAAELTEQMGTKFKFWYQDRERGLSLFKEGRPETGENWAEVIACELAELMQLPHAHYQFATFREKTGITTPSLVTNSSRLIHGNELLARFTAASGNATPTDITNNNYKKRDHTIGRVLSYFHRADELKVPNDFDISTELSTALDIFFGYLIFDAWIANQDRHDQN